MAVVQSIHAPRVVDTKRVQGIHAPRVLSRERVRDVHALRNLTGRVQGVHAPRVAQVQGVQSVHALRNQQWAQEFAQVYFPEYAGSANNFVQIGTSLKLHNLSGGTVDDLTPYLLGWEIVQRRSSPSTMRVTLFDKDRVLRPFQSPGDPFYGKFKGDNFDAVYNIRRYWELQTTVRGETWTSPWFLLLDYEWEYQSSPIVTLSFTDLSELALQDNFEMDDFVSTPGNVWTAKRIIAAILGVLRIPAVLEFTPDYPVAKFSPKGGKALDYIKKLLHVVQAEWEFQGKTFYAHNRNYSPQGPAMWSFVDRNHIKQVSVRYSVRDLINEVTIKKVEPSNVLGEAECSGGDCLGFQTVSLNPPANAATLVLEEITNYDPSWLPTSDRDPKWYDQNGTQLGTGWGYSGTPASSVQWAYAPRLDVISHEGGIGGIVNIPWNGGWTPGYRAVVYGKPLGSADLPGFDPSYTITVTNSPSQAIYGRRPERTPIEDALIPSGAVAEIMGTRMIEESIRTTDTSDWEGPLQPFVLPSQMIDVSVTLGGLVQRIYYVEAVRKRGTRSAGWMSVEMSKFPD